MTITIARTYPNVGRGFGFEIWFNHRLKFGFRGLFSYLAVRKLLKRAQSPVTSRIFYGGNEQQASNFKFNQPNSLPVA